MLAGDKRKLFDFGASPRKRVVGIEAFRSVHIELYNWWTLLEITPQSKMHEYATHGVKPSSVRQNISGQMKAVELGFDFFHKNSSEICERIVDIREGRFKKYPNQDFR